MSNRFDSWIVKASEFISSRWPKRPRFGIVLGTGAGIVADQIQADTIIPYSSIPHFPVSTATGHKGNLVCGRFAGQDIVAMQGRFHLYEGYDVDAATLPIHVMHSMGVEVLFVSNAAGGLNPKMASGDLMLIDSHIDLMNRNSIRNSPNQSTGRIAKRSDQAYCDQLKKAALSISRRDSFSLHVGVYGAMMGPNYETRAEYRFLRRIGADVAGMSTVPEVNVAAKYDIRVLAMSIITNVANPDSLDSTSGEEVIDAAKVAAPNLARIVSDVIQAES